MPTKLANKHIELDDFDKQSVIQALDRKDLSGNAKIVEEYEEKLRNYFNTKHALAYCNGTATLHAALLAFGVQRGDEVMLPCTAPVMTALPVLLIGAKPVFVDSAKPNTFTYDLNDLQSKKTEKTKAVMTVPMWGYPIEMKELVKTCHDSGLPLLEDVAQAHGSKTDGQYLGTYGDIGSFSTHQRKLICTGEGGILLTNNTEYYEKMLEIRAFGRVIQKTPELIEHQGAFGVLFGLNYKINALGAALGITQLEKLSTRIIKRTQNAEKLKQGLKNVSWIKEIPVDSSDTPNYYALVLEVDSDFASGKEVSEYLLEENIVSDTYEYNYKPLYEMPLFKTDTYQCPNAKKLTQQIITLPTHEGLSAIDLERMVTTIKNYEK